MKFSPDRWYLENKPIFWITVLVGIPLVLSFGSVVAPEMFWDRFIYRYYWGPIVADSQDAAVNGISAGYNWVNTLTYGIGVVLSLLGIYELIESYDIKVDGNFVLSLLPWILLGGSLRTLEDVGLFSKDVSYLFISPVIYFFLGVSAISGMILGAKYDQLDLQRRERFVRMLLISPPLIFLLLFRPELMWYLLPLTIGMISLFYVMGERYGWRDEKYVLSSNGTAFLGLALAYNFHFIFTKERTNPWEAVIIPLLAAGTTVLLVLFVRGLDAASSRSERDRYVNYFTPRLNLLIIFAHLFDASATFRGVQYYGYVEKHVLPSLAIETLGTPLVMFLLKIPLIIAIIYVLDVLYAEELGTYPQLKNLIKFVIITLGLAPAVRNTIRLAMGV